MGHKQIKDVRFIEKNEWLKELDTDFINLKERRHITLFGKELLEKNPIKKFCGLLIPVFFRKRAIVTANEGAKYFKDSYTVEATDHFSIAEPADKSAKQHRLLCQFIKESVEPFEEIEEDKTTQKAQIDSLCKWIDHTTSKLTIPGIKQSLPMDDAWIEITATEVSQFLTIPTGLAEALEDYHAWTRGDRRRNSDIDIIKGKTIARFVHHCVVVGGPGMGKSTLLKKLARTYASEGYPVLLFSANTLAQRIKSTGCSFEEGIITLGTDGSGLSISPQMLSTVSHWIVLCDALDEAGSDQEIVSEGFIKFAAGYPNARIVTTTRPIGYTSGCLSSWRHYELQPLESKDVLLHVMRIIRAVVNPKELDQTLKFAKDQIDQNINARIVARSPLILALVSALSIQGVVLGDTKTQLYQRLFDQMKVEKSGLSLNKDLTSAILSEFLDLLSWEMLLDPTVSVKVLLTRCGDHLAELLSESKLNARIKAEKCFAHWEQNGLVEKVNYAGIEVATFIHKTFGEYAAACYIAKMPNNKVHKEINLHINDKAWSEVIVFASSLGLADMVLESLIGAKATLSNQAKLT